MTADTDDTGSGAAVDSFEGALAGLEARVRKLEAGDVPLDEALGLFEEGVSLARTCHRHLDAAESRVEALTRGPAGPEGSPMPDPVVDED